MRVVVFPAFPAFTERGVVPHRHFFIGDGMHQTGKHKIGPHWSSDELAAALEQVKDVQEVQVGFLLVQLTVWCLKLLCVFVRSESLEQRCSK
jgi:hypothetical protein